VRGEERRGEVSGAVTLKLKLAPRTLSSNSNFLLNLNLRFAQLHISTFRLHIFHILFGGNRTNVTRDSIDYVTHHEGSHSRSNYDFTLPFSVRA
jgi:hypothetical protein